MLGGEVGLADAGLCFGPFKVGLLGGALVCGGCTSALGGGSLQTIPQESPSSSSLMDACFRLAKTAFKSATCWPRPFSLPSKLLVHAAAAPEGAGKAIPPEGEAGAAVGAGVGAGSEVGKSQEPRQALAHALWIPLNPLLGDTQPALGWPAPPEQGLTSVSSRASA